MPDGGQAEAFFAALRHLRMVAGEPSVREIARLTGQLSHDTVHRTLTGPALPRWGNAEAVVRALGADPETVKPLWLAARTATERPSRDTEIPVRAAVPAPLTVPGPDLPVRVVLVCDAPVFLLGLSTAFGEAGLRVLGEVDDISAAHAVVAEQRPDVVLVAVLSARAAVQVTTRLLESDPSTRVLVLATGGAMLEVVKAGAMGYLEVNATAPEIVRAVRQVAAGASVFGAEVASRLLTHYREGDARPPLTSRESEVLRLAADGLTNRQIAERLALSVRTVESFMSRLFAKLGVESRAALVRYAIVNDLDGE